MHFMYDTASDEEFMNLGQKLIALYNIYFTPMRKILPNHKDVANEILDGTRKIETDFNLMVNHYFDAIMAESVFKPNNDAPLEKEPLEKAVCGSEKETAETCASPQTVEQFLSEYSGTLVGGGPFWSKSSATASTTSLGGVSHSSASASSSSGSISTPPGK